MQLDTREKIFFLYNRVLRLTTFIAKNNEHQNSQGNKLMQILLTCELFWFIALNIYFKVLRRNYVIFIIRYTHIIEL